jgi:tetratricopeptide (TPR) repeat protein
MKQYLYAKINYTTHQKDKLNNNTTHSVYASHLLISQLGDLHYYDDEFIDAILQYKNSIIQIRQISVQDMDFSQFINYIKTMLKIGLTYERMGNSDKALAYYEEASVEVIKYR